MLAALHFVMVFRIACRASREEQENPRNPFPFFFPFSKWGPVHTPGDPPVGAGSLGRCHRFIAGGFVTVYLSGHPTKRWGRDRKRQRGVLGI
jgi:hypothetical protein